MGGGTPKKVGGDFYTAGRGYPPPPTFLSATTWRSPEEAGMNFERGLIRGGYAKKGGGRIFIQRVGVTPSLFLRYYIFRVFEDFPR